MKPISNWNNKKGECCMTKFILFIIILNFVVVIYNLYMWFKVGIENDSLKKENDELRYYLNLEYKRNIRKD